MDELFDQNYYCDYVAFKRALLFETPEIIAHKHMVEVLQLRGLNVPDDYEFLESQKLTGSLKSVWVFVLKTCNIDLVRDVKFSGQKFSNLAKKTGHVIIFTENKPTTDARLFLRTLSVDHNVHIEVFKQADLLLTVLNHKFQPRDLHVLSNSEQQQLVKQYHIKLEQLPSMKVSDIWLKFNGCKVGDVISYTRVKGGRCPSERMFRRVTD